MSDREERWPDELSDEVEPSAEELAEAEALAHALERNVARGVSAEVLEAAALLRIGHAPQLGAEAEQRIWAEVNAQAKFPVETSERLGSLRWLWALLPALAGAAVLLVYFGVGEEELAPGARAVVIPEPPPDLLRAQAEYLQNEEAEARAEFDKQMGEYRSSVLDSLEGYYR